MDIQSRPVLIARTPEGFTVAISGAVHTNVSWLESELDKVVAARPALVDLDLGSTAYLSSWGLGVLVSFRRRLSDNGGTLRVTRIRDTVARVFKYAYLDKIFELEKAQTVAGE